MKIKNESGLLEVLKRLSGAAVLSFALLVAADGDLFAGRALESLQVLAGPDAAVEVPAISTPSLPSGPAISTPVLNAYFLAVGQGDAEYIELPNGRNVLIDGGPSPVAPLAQFLSEHNITKIDYVVLTHPHLDHYSGLIYVFDKLQVSNFYDTREDNARAASIKTLRARINELGVNVVYPAPGDELAWDPDVKVKVLNSCPEAGSSSEGNVLNDCSIVLKVTYQNTSILYTGDMEADVEAKLVAAYGDELRSDVLKVGHHGSVTASSPDFLAKVMPKLAYLEVGYANTFNFPSTVTMANLAAAGATPYLTYMTGTQVYTITGQPGLPVPPLPPAPPLPPLPPLR